MTDGILFARRCAADRDLQSGALRYAIKAILDRLEIVERQALNRSHASTIYEREYFDDYTQSYAASGTPRFKLRRPKRKNKS
jgi:hypothetical protein